MKAAEVSVQFCLPDFRLSDLSGLTYVTEDLLNDPRSLDELIKEAFADAFKGRRRKQGIKLT